ncbi:MAG: hypothetical protein R3F30_07685 [Planctomycetota bacterium]
MLVAIDSGAGDGLCPRLSPRAGPAFDPEGREGLAEWTARSLPGRGLGPASGHRIADLGGRLRLEVGDERIALELAGPRPALDELASLLLTVVGIEVPDLAPTTSEPRDPAPGPRAAARRAPAAVAAQAHDGLRRPGAGRAGGGPRGARSRPWPRCS